MAPPDPVSRAIAALADRRDLSADLAEAAFAQVMRGEASAGQMSALLMGLRVKGETAGEVVGAVRALRQAMVRVLAPDGGPLVDTCGTGGGRVLTFNISTAAAIVVAGAGVRVAKHGNRSFTSQSGSADVLEALGVTIPPNAERAVDLLAAARMTFLFAPLFHPAMKHVGPVRRELAITTMMNLLGPLANPAGVRRQVIGVADAARAPLLAEALAVLGAERALVVHARAGLDEIAPDGATDVWEVAEGEVRTWVIEPAAWRLPGGPLADLAGGTPAENADIVRAVIAGTDTSVRRSAVLLNAAAGLLVAGLAADWPEALEAARAAIADGRAADVLERLVAASGE
jgi:anthranilate phosphoribosyltransferase